MSERGVNIEQHVSSSSYYADEMPVLSQAPAVIHSSSIASATSVDDDIQDTEEYVEESFSLEDMEREAISKVLEKYKGRRKLAAAELKISERTLYRKIKEYGLD